MVVKSRTRESCYDALVLIALIFHVIQSTYNGRARAGKRQDTHIIRQGLTYGYIHETTHRAALMRHASSPCLISVLTLGFNWVSIAVQLFHVLDQNATAHREAEGQYSWLGSIKISRLRANGGWMCDLHGRTCNAADSVGGGERGEYHSSVLARTHAPPAVMSACENTAYV